MFLNCEDPSLQYKEEYPIVITEEVTNVNETGVDFVGTIKATGQPSDRVEFGFVWSVDSKEPTLSNAQVIRLSVINGNRITVRISNDLRKNEKYVVRAFYKNAKWTVYGNIVNFNSQGSLTQTIKNVQPMSGFNGDMFIISGDNFGFTKERNIVYLDGYQCNIIQADMNNLYVLVPEFIDKKDYRIRVIVAGRVVDYKDFFTVLGRRE